MPDGHCRNIVLAAIHGQPWSSGLAPVSRSHSSVPLSHSSPSLTGLPASVDVKQQKLPHVRPAAARGQLRARLVETGDPADRQTSHDTSVTKQMTDDSTSVRDVNVAGWGRGGGFFLSPPVSSPGVM